jgi:hypothetical protein
VAVGRAIASHDNSRFGRLIAPASTAGATGYVTAWPDGQTRPFTSTLNVNGPNPIPNLAVVPVGADGYIDLYNSAGTVNLFGDISGYLSP